LPTISYPFKKLKTEAFVEYRAANGGKFIIYVKSSQKLCQFIRQDNAIILKESVE
jgi:hypothetical protein